MDRYGDGLGDAHQFIERALITCIQGGVLGQMLGNLNGLSHEFKYIDEPGDVRDYTPSLPRGAHTDDDRTTAHFIARSLGKSLQIATAIPAYANMTAPPVPDPYPVCRSPL